MILLGKRSSLLVGKEIWIVCLVEGGVAIIYHINILNRGRHHDNEGRERDVDKNFTCLTD